MKYSELLNKYIKDSRLSLNDLVKKITEEQNIKIDKSYISKLKNGNANPPSDDISIALASATGGDPKELVLAGYYERAPLGVKKELKKISVYDKLMEFLVAKKPFKIEYHPSNYENLTEEERLKIEQSENDFFNSPDVLLTMSEEVRDQFFDDLLTIMAKEYPDDFNDLIEGYLAKKAREAGKDAEAITSGEAEETKKGNQSQNKISPSSNEDTNISFFGGPEKYTPDEIEEMEAALKRYREMKKRAAQFVEKKNEQED